MSSCEEFFFGCYRLDVARRQLLRNGEPVALGNKAFDILLALASAGGKLVTKDALLDQVWPGLTVAENNVQVHVSAARKAMAEENGPVHLVTVPGRGYRLAGMQEPKPVRVAGTSALRLDVLADRASVAVLAFENLNHDPEQEFFADGMVEEIICGLSRIRSLLVIARSSSLAYRDKMLDLRQVGHELGVRYILLGTVRRSRDRLRIAANLIEGATSMQVWAEIYDRPIGDVFDIQDEIAKSVIGAIEPGIRKQEIRRVARKRPDSLDAYERVLHAIPSLYSLMPTDLQSSIAHLQEALALEPDYAFAHAVLAWCHHVRFSRGGLLEEDRAKAIHHARQAASGSTDDATTLAISGFVIWFDEHDTATAIDLFDKALDLGPSNVIALYASAVVLAWMGESETALVRAHRALRLSPADSWNCLSYQAIACANFHLKRFEESVTAARRAVAANPGFSVPHLYLAAGLVRSGHVAEAASVAQRALALDPTFTIQKFSRTVGVVPAVYQSYAEAWREVGLPA